MNKESYPQSSGQNENSEQRICDHAKIPWQRNENKFKTQILVLHILLAWKSVKLCFATQLPWKLEENYFELWLFK